MIRKIVTGVIFVSAPAFTYADENRTQIGFSVGTPAGLNFVLKKNVAGLPLQVSGFYFGKIYGVEAGYSFYRNEDSHVRSIQLVAGTSTIEEDEHRYYTLSGNLYYEEYEDKKEWNYIGVSTSFHFGGFFIEPGLNVGSGEYSSPQLSLQLGWLWSL